MLLGVSNGSVSRNTILTEREIGQMLVTKLRNYLPEGWAVEPVVAPAGKRSNFDLMLDIASPSGESLRAAVKIKSRLEPRDVDYIALQLGRVDAGVHLVTAPFISERSRQMLRDAGLSFMDAAGNAEIRSARPALVINISGLASHASGSHPLKSLKGGKTARMLRFLCDVRPPYGIREIAAKIHLHPGNVSRIADFLDREALITRDLDGAIRNVAWRSLIAQWAPDLERSRIQKRYLEPRGVGAFLSKLPTGGIVYSLTGTAAAQKIALASPATFAMCYVDDINTAATALDLHEAERSANIYLLKAFDECVFQGTQEIDHLTLASPPQIAADLLINPARDTEEAEFFMNWMEAHEQQWRAH